MSIDIGLLAEELKRDEGKSPDGCGYKCTADKWTIGYGHNIEDNPIPEHIAEALLSHDIGQALAQCERFAWFYLLNGVRKRIIVNMVFNIGFNGVCNFKKMIAAIEDKDFDLAADEMVDSKWYKQVGERAQRVVAMMRWG